MADNADAPYRPLNEPTEVGRRHTESPESTDAADDTSRFDGQVDTESPNEPAEIGEAVSTRPPRSSVRMAIVVGVVTVAVLGALAGWLGFRSYQFHQSGQQQKLFLQVARQGALNLTTIDYNEVDTDIKRILESATGTFYADFSQRAESFIEVVKQAKSTSRGTITEAALESMAGESAQALVAVAVDTSNAGAADQEARHWRMRITVQRVGDEIKVSDVGFVP